MHMQDLESFVSLQLVLHLLVLHLLVQHLLVLHLLVLHLLVQHLSCLCNIFLCSASVCYTLLCCKDATCTVPQYANSHLSLAIGVVYLLQLDLHLLMMHLLMVHLLMVHLHVLHLLAMHLIGLQLVQFIDTPTVVFHMQLFTTANLLVDPSKTWRRASGKEKNP